LKFRNDEREARDLGREVAQLDPAKVRKGNFRTAVRLASPPVDLGLDRARLCRR
jgi:hypothetical protein